MIGPPSEKPYWSRRWSGLSPVLKKSRASKLDRCPYHQPLPWKLFDPCLRTMFMIVPPLLPNSAEKLLFWTLNSCTISTEGVK